MNKWVIAAGVFVAGILIVKMYDGDLVTTDIFQVMDDRDEISQSYEDLHADLPDPDGYFMAMTPISFANKEITPFEEDIEAAILPADSEFGDMLSVFFARLKDSKNIERFIVVGDNHFWEGKHTIAGSKYGYETEYGILNPDLNLIEDLGVGTSYSAFRNEPGFESLAPYIKYYFPDSTLTVIAVKDFEKGEVLNDFAIALAENTDDDTFVIGSTLFSQKISNQTAKFHLSQAIDTIETFDKDRIPQMDVDSVPLMKIFFDYLEEIDAQSAHIESAVIGDKGGMVVSFSEGEPVKAESNVTIMAFGDMMLGRYVRTLMNENGMSYIFKNIMGYEGKFFEGADVIFGNLEGPIHGQGTSGGTAMVFSFNKDIAEFLKKYGFNLFSIANNHAVDQGWKGRATTLEALNEQELGWCGHPSEVDPDSVYYGTVGDKEFAFVCFQDVNYKLDDEAAVELIKEIDEKVDHLIVSVHWGYEYKHRPDFNTEESPGRAFVDAGADFVIGHHPHVVQSFEEYNGKFIFYSLGNFVFDQYWSQMTQEELAIGIELEDDEESLTTKVHLFPMKSEMSQSRLMTDEEYSEWIERFVGYGDYSEKMKGQIRSGVIEISSK